MTAVETVQNEALTTLELGNYYIDLVKIEFFKDYYYSHLNKFSKISYDSFLRALDIPPKFFKEQPEETRDELLDNREIFIKEHKKYLEKVIVVTRNKLDDSILNCCRMSSAEANVNYKHLKPIDEVTNKFEHRSFIKDSYITYVIADKLENKKDNKVLVIDFPLTLNKKTIIHHATYTLPDETFATPVEHIHYISNLEVDYEMEYANIKEAIEDNMKFLTEPLEVREAEDILREPEVVALALEHAGVIPHGYLEKVGYYIKENSKGILNTHKLESLVLDYDETFRSYKHVTSLREVSGFNILEILNSSAFKEFIDEMESIKEELE